MTSPSLFEMNGKQYQCAIELAVSIISGRWKPTIICKLFAGKHRYGELKKGIVGINHKMLAEQLKELESACHVAIKREAKCKNSRIHWLLYRYSRRSFMKLCHKVCGKSY
jgi:DNA-binding HxlR family transcriptional regulator